MIKTKIHVVDEGSNRVLFWMNRSGIPDVGDEIRTGGPKNPRYYRVTRRVFIEDEDLVGDMERVNIGVVDVTDDDITI